MIGVAIKCIFRLIRRIFLVIIAVIVLASLIGCGAKKTVVKTDITTATEAEQHTNTEAVTEVKNAVVAVDEVTHEETATEATTISEYITDYDTTGAVVRETLRVIKRDTQNNVTTHTERADSVLFDIVQYENAITDEETATSAEINSQTAVKKGLTVWQIIGAIMLAVGIVMLACGILKKVNRYDYE